MVDGFKSINAYHAGDGVWAEMDLLLDEKTPLNKAHDIAETLQYCCEGLKEVDRAFVSTDCELLLPFPFLFWIVLLLSLSAFRILLINVSLGGNDMADAWLHGRYERRTDWARGPAELIRDVCARF